MAIIQTTVVSKVVQKNKEHIKNINLSLYFSLLGFSNPQKYFRYFELPIWVFSNSLLESASREK